MSEKEIIVNTTVPIDEAVGEEKYEEILNKDWKVADLPVSQNVRIITESGRRYNPKSLANLVQYRKRDKESKEKSLSKLRPRKKIKVTTSTNTPFDSNDKISAIINMLPIDLIFDEAERTTFEAYVKVLLKDFNLDELSSGDIDDILSIAQMRVLELRLLRLCKEKPSNLLDASLSIEKLRKDMNKAKESLGSRRKDRITVKDRSDITILDLARLFDVEKRQKLDLEEVRLKEEEDQLSREIFDKGYVGNSRDYDALVVDEEEEGVDS